MNDKHTKLTNTHSITLMGEPISDARPRARVIKKGAKAIPKRCEWCIASVYDKLSKDKYQLSFQLGTLYDSTLYETPKNKFKIKDVLFIEIDFKFYNKIRKSANKLSKKMANLEILRNINVIDTDNLIKLYLDCLHGVVYDNDCLVTKVSGEKLFTDTEDRERVEIEVRVYKYDMEVD